MSIGLLYRIDRDSLRQIQRFDRARLLGSLLLLACIGCGQHETTPSTESVDSPAANAAVSDHTRMTRSSTAVTSTTRVQLAHRQAQQRREQGLLDPATDGWLSEAFAEDAKHQLEALFEILATHDVVSAQQLSDVVTSDGTARRLRPDLSVAYEDDVLRVFRPLDHPPAETTMASALTELAMPLRAVGPIAFHVKIIRVDLQDTGPVTLALYDASAADSGQSIQQTAQLRCVWDDSDPAQPRLRRLESDQFEEVHSKLNGGKWYVDCTQSVVGTDPAFRRQLGYGLNHWMQRIERAHHMDDSVRNGLAIGDSNNDGLDDVYVCQGPGLPNRLLIQQRDGTVKDRAAEAGVDWLDQTSSALFLDLDNDGDQDLSVATMGGLLVMENDGTGHFVLRSKLGEEQSDPQSLTGCDYDRDGDVDLFLCVYRPPRGGRRGDFVFHDATTGGPNKLFRNDVADGRWEFADVTRDVGLGEGATRYSLAAAWSDYDADGDQDLYVANDYGRNYLYRNEEGRFQDVTDEAGLSDTGFGMSVSWGDYNRDGRIDLYIGNMFSSAGSRITRQVAFQQNASPQQRALYQRMAKGNTLFAQQSDGTFEDVSGQAAVEMGRWAWSSVFADLNVDGWEDIVVGNGYITTEDTGDL